MCLAVQNLTETMIEDVANDFDVLDYSAATAGAVLDTLALVSGSETSLTRDSQVREDPTQSVPHYQSSASGCWGRTLHWPAGR